MLVAPAQAEATRQQRLASLATGDAALAAGEQGYYLDVLYAQMRQILGPDAVLERGAGTLRLVLPSAVRFEVASAQLSDAALAVLDPILVPLADYRSLMISVHGHTDASGPAEVNQRLSAQRALTVANKLVTLGVPASQVMAIGHGADQPAADNETPEGRQANRRVELLLEVIQGRGA
jgi:outer membrane protein OmpA-like peptidoglycan-associated protein